MRGARKRPGRRNEQNVRVMLQRERARDLRKTQIVTDAQAEVESFRRYAHEFIPRRVAGTFIIRREDEEMRLAIARHDLAARVDKDLRVVNGFAVTLGNAAHDRE